MKPTKPTTRIVVMPLGPDDRTAERKARVAELHALWCAAGFSVPVYQLLLNERRSVRADDYRGVSYPTRGPR